MKKGNKLYYPGNTFMKKNYIDKIIKKLKICQNQRHRPD